MTETALIRTLLGHTDGVSALSFSPCGKFLATAGEDHTIRLWDNQDGIEIRTLQAHEGGVRSVVFDPDGDLFASASGDRTVKLWRTSDCATLAEASSHDGPVNCLAFSPDGKLLFSGSDDGAVRLFSSPGGALKGTIKPGIGEIKTLAVSATGLLAVGGLELRFLDTSGNLLKDNEDYLHGIKGLDFSPDGKLLAAATGMEKRLEIWNAETLVEAGSIKDQGWINCVTFTPDGKNLVTGGTSVKIWDPVSGTCLRAFEGHTDEICAVGVSPDGSCIASASNDRAVKLWSL